MTLLTDMFNKSKNTSLVTKYKSTFRKQFLWPGLYSLIGTILFCVHIVYKYTIA